MPRKLACDVRGAISKHWWRAVEAGAEAIVQTASGCGAIRQRIWTSAAAGPRTQLTRAGRRGLACWPAIWWKCSASNRWRRISRPPPGGLHFTHHVCFSTNRGWAVRWRPC